MTGSGEAMELLEGDNRSYLVKVLLKAGEYINTEISAAALLLDDG